MLNHLRADLNRVFSRPLSWVFCLLASGRPRWRPPGCRTGTRRNSCWPAFRRGSI